MNELVFIDQDRLTTYFNDSKEMSEDYYKEYLADEEDSKYASYDELFNSQMTKFFETLYSEPYELPISDMMELLIDAMGYSSELEEEVGASFQVWFMEFVLMGIQSIYPNATDATIEIKAISNNQLSNRRTIAVIFALK